MAHSIKFTLLFLTSFLVSCSSSPEQESHGSCGLIYYGNYGQILLESYDSIKPEVRIKLELHLEKYLGNSLKESIEFNEAYYTNYNELLYWETSAKDYEWIVSTYDIFYRFKNQELELDNYCASISLDSVGNVINEISLPSPELNTNADHFISLNELKKVAKSHDYPNDRYKFDYFDNRIVIKFSDIKQGEYWKELKVCAHTGEIITKGEVSGIVDWY